MQHLKDFELLNTIVQEDWKIESNGHDFHNEWIRATVKERRDRLGEDIEKLKTSKDKELILDAIEKEKYLPEESFCDKDSYWAYIGLMGTIWRRLGVQSLDMSGGKCSECGERFSHIRIDEDTKTLTLCLIKPGKLVEPDTCKYAEVESIDAKISVKGNLLFTNFFKKNGELIFDEFDDDICTTKGLMKLTKRSSESDVLFGQTGNMSVHIYQKGNRIHLLESDAQELLNELGYIIEDVAGKNNITKEEAEKLLGADKDSFMKLRGADNAKYYVEDADQAKEYAKWDHKGSVSCEMWRFMATPKENFEKMGLEIDHWTDEPVIVEIEDGEYEMKHYWRVSDKGMLVSKIEPADQAETA